MKTVVIGAASFIGQAIIHMFDERTPANRVRRADITFAAREDSSADEVFLDIRERQAVDTFVKGADVVVLVAAALSTSFDRDPRTAIETNVLGALNVVEATARSGARLVFSSSCGVYGELLPGTNVSEITEYRLSGAPTNVAGYGAAKLLIEFACELYRGLHPSFSWAALRYPTVYGAGQHRRAVHSLNIADNAERMARGEQLAFSGDPREGHDYVHARDVALANYLAATAPYDQVNRAFVIASGTSTTTQALAETFASVAEYDGEILWEAVPEDRHRLHRIDLTFDISSAQEHLGYVPEVSLQEGILESLQHAHSKVAR